MSKDFLFLAGLLYFDNRITQQSMNKHQTHQNAKFLKQTYTFATRKSIRKTHKYLVGGSSIALKALNGKRSYNSNHR